MEIFGQTLIIINLIFIITFFFVIAVRLTQMLVTSYKNGKDRRQRYIADLKGYMGMENIIPVSVILPVYNKENIIVDSIKSLLALDYDNKEIIVVNDGSTDNTHLHIINHFALEEIEYSVKRSVSTKNIQRVYYNAQYPALIYVVKRNGGIADSINCGINVSQCPAFMCVEPGVHIDKDTLLKLSFEFFKDSSVTAASGIIRPGIGFDATVTEKGVKKTGFAAAMQAVECTRLSSYRLTSDAYHSLFTEYGPFMLLFKQSVANSGGYRIDTDGTFYDMMIKIRQSLSKNKRKYVESIKSSIVYRPASIDSVGELLNRHIYCQVGIIDALCASWKSLFNFKNHGFFGVFWLPYQWISNVLFVLLEGVSYITIPLAVAFGFMTHGQALYFIAAYMLLHIFVSLSGMVVDQQTGGNVVSPKSCKVAFMYCVIEVLGYHQLTVLNRCMGIMNYLTYKRLYKKKHKL